MNHRQQSSGISVSVWAFLLVTIAALGGVGYWILSIHSEREDMKIRMYTAEEKAKAQEFRQKIQWETEKKAAGIPDNCQLCKGSGFASGSGKSCQLCGGTGTSK